MTRLLGAPVLAVVVAVACSDSTGPSPAPPRVAGPSLQAVPSEHPCVGVIAGGTWQNVFVPEGATCTITGATLTGNLKALAESELIALRNTIAGGIHADRARRVLVEFGSVGQDIIIADGSGSSGAFFDYDVRFVTLRQGNIHVIKNTGGIAVFANVLGVPGATLGGNIKVEDNHLPGGDPSVFVFGSMFVQGNTGAQNVQVFKNRGEGSKFVTFNTAESVQCKENAMPFLGSPNVARTREEQCAP